MNSPIRVRPSSQPFRVRIAPAIPKSPEPTLPPALLDEDETLAYLGHPSPSWLRDRDKDGTLRAVRLGRLRRWRVVDLDAYVASLSAGAEKP